MDANYVKNTWVEDMQEIFESVSSNFVLKSTISAFLTFLTSMVVWDPYLYNIWLFMFVIDAVLRLAIAVFSKSKRFPISSTLSTMLTKLFMYSIIIWVFNVLSKSIIHSEIDTSIVFVNYVIVFCTCIEALYIFESLMVMGLPVGKYEIKLLQTFLTRLQRNVQMNLQNTRPMYEETEVYKNDKFSE